MTSRSGASESELIEHKGEVFIVINEDIQSIETPGSSQIAAGVLGGGCIGCLVGYGFGCSKEVKQEKDDLLRCNAFAGQGGNAASYGILGGAGGMLVGGILGGTLSTKDSLWVTPRNRNFKTLNALARYPYEEPEFLRELGE